MKKILATIILAFGIAGCATNYSTLKNSESSTQTLYQISEKDAQRIAYTGMVTTMPGREVTTLNGPVLGYTTWTRFVLDTYTQQVLIFKAQGTDKQGSVVTGYYFDVSGKGTSGSGMATNGELFRKIEAAAKDTNQGIAVTNVQILSN